MTNSARRTGAALFGVALCAVLTRAQTDPASIRPLRTAPKEALTANPGFRDWGPTAIAGTTILGGNVTGGGGLFAIDTASGKVKWTFRPAFTTGTASVSTTPAVSGDIVITPFAAAYPGAVVAVSLATGKELWRGPDPERGAGVAAHAGLAYVLSKDGRFHALDAATGREKWSVAFTTNRAACASQPIVRGDTIYLTGIGAATPGDATKPAGYYLFALDTATGQERWRYRAEVPYVPAGACLRQPVVTADAVFAAGDNFLYAVSRATGTERWKPIEVRRPVDGRVRAVEVDGLVDAGSALVGMSSGFLIAFDKANGQTLWEMPGKYNTGAPSTAVAGRVLYFQGSPDAPRGPGNSDANADTANGTLRAMDLDTRAILWSFTRQTATPNWPFGAVTPVDGGLWVSSYQALLKLL